MSGSTAVVEARKSAFMPLRKFVPSDVVEEMRRDSFEQVAERVSSAVRRDRSLFAQSFGEEVRPLATFKGKVVVGTSAGRFLRAEWRQTDEGQIRFTKVEAIADVPVRAYHEVAEDTLRSAARSILEGKPQDAAKLLREAGGVLSYAGVNRPDDLARLLREHINAPRAWRRYVAARADKLRGFLGLGEAEGLPLQAKYRALWEGDEPSPERMLDVVRGEANDLFGRIRAAAEEARKAYDAYTLALPTFRGIAEDETPAMFETLASDYFMETEGVLDTAVRVVESDDARALAMAFDSVLEHSHEFEIAARFVKALSEELTNPQGRSNA